MEWEQQMLNSLRVVLVDLPKNEKHFSSQRK